MFVESDFDCTHTQNTIQEIVTVEFWNDKKWREYYYLIILSIIIN